MKKDLLYEITKILAENDSIAEGYGYCKNYDLNRFNDDLKMGGYGYISVAKEIMALIKKSSSIR